MSAELEPVARLRMLDPFGATAGPAVALVWVAAGPQKGGRRRVDQLTWIAEGDPDLLVEALRCARTLLDQPDPPLPHLARAVVMLWAAIRTTPRGA